MGFVSARIAGPGVAGAAEIRIIDKGGE